MSYPLEVVALDFLSLSRPSDTYQNVLVMTDMFTRYAWAVPTRDQTAIWTNVIQVIGCPSRFHSDQGPNFESDLMKQLCIMYNVSKSRTTPYHPAGNGRVERFNQTLLNMLRTLEVDKQSKWPDHLPELLQDYNNTVHSATGFAPAYLMFGRHLRLPLDASLGVAPTQRRQNAVTWVNEHNKRLKSAYELAHRKMWVTASREKGYYDQKANAPLLLPGERVWVRDRNREGHGKLHSWWDPEPHVVVETVGDSGLVYKIRPEKGGKVKTLHRNALKLRVGPIQEAPKENPAEEKESNAPTPILYFPPRFRAPIEPTGVHESLRRSARTNLGQPPACYR